MKEDDYNFKDEEMEAYKEMFPEEKHKANIPIWKGAMFLAVFAGVVYYWDLICEVVSKMFNL